MDSKVERVAEAVGMCHYPHVTDDGVMSSLAGLLWEIAKGTRWEQDARSGIEGAYPRFFEED